MKAYEVGVVGGAPLRFETAEEAVMAVAGVFYVAPASREAAVAELESGIRVWLSYGSFAAQIVPVEVAA